MSNIARILAFSIEASQFAGALGIHRTSLGLYGNQVAAHGRIAAISSRTTALGAVIVDTTLSTYAAVAGILATFIAASKMEGTLVIAAAFRTLATHKRRLSAHCSLLVHSGCSTG